MFKALTVKHRRCQMEKWSGHSSEKIWATPPVKAPSPPTFLIATVPQVTDVRDLGVPLDDLHRVSPLQIGCEYSKAIAVHDQNVLL